MTQTLQEAQRAAGMPARIQALGCGLHRFEERADHSYHCQNAGCPTRVYPGMLLYWDLRAHLKGGAKG